MDERLSLFIKAFIHLSTSHSTRLSIPTTVIGGPILCR